MLNLISRLRKKLFPPLALLILPALFLTGCAGSASDSAQDSGFYFDTVISVRIYGKNSRQLLAKCMELAADYEQLLSATLEGSDVWNINHSDGAWVSVAEDTTELLDAALAFAEISEGAVDPTVGALSALWNFGSGNEGIVPSREQIDAALSHIDYRAVVINENQVRLTDPQARIDLGFIAKGFIGDKMKEYLLSQGVESALINLGGNVVTLGEKPDHTPFRIGIRDPFQTDGSPLMALDLTDKSVVSSGNYERFFEKDGKRYHHILSTHTGYPAWNGLAQVSILCPDATRADALSTLCFVLGEEKAASLLENYPDVQAIFVSEDGSLSYVNF